MQTACLGSVCPMRCSHIAWRPHICILRKSKAFPRISASSQGLLSLWILCLQISALGHVSVLYLLPLQVLDAALSLISVIT